jgi:hypothetical protein
VKVLAELDLVMDMVAVMVMVNVYHLLLAVTNNLMFDFFYLIYLPMTAISYGIAVILLFREVRSRNFRMSFGGTYNILLYYKEIRRRNEKLSKRFWFFVFSTANLLICMILFLSIAITIATGKLRPF